MFIQLIGTMLFEVEYQINDKKFCVMPAFTQKAKNDYSLQTNEKLQRTNKTRVVGENEWMEET